MLDDIALFIHIVQQGGLSAAASFLNMPAATVTRRLQKLEQDLGCQLLHRSARQCIPTQEGELYYQNYVELIEQFEQTRQQLSADIKQLSGKLKVLAPSNFSHSLLQPMWLGFMRQYPDIQLDLQLSNQLQDILKCKADLAIRIGQQPDSLLYQQKLGELQTILVAAPTFIHEFSWPQPPSQLKDYRLLGSTLRNKWKLMHNNTHQQQEIFPRFSCLSNDLSFLKSAAVDGQGIALLPLNEVRQELQQGLLWHVLPQWCGERREVYVVWPSGRLLSAKAKCLRSYMQNYLQPFNASF